jgi:hypothetical protein
MWSEKTLAGVTSARAGTALAIVIKDKTVVHFI